MIRRQFGITKTERLADGRLLVEGIATSDSLDSQGEVLEFPGSVKALSKWLETGPAVREAHDPKKPVGRGLEMFPDDESKRITVRAFVSKGAPDTQEKVLDGTLAMFSVGGTPTQSVMEKRDGKSVRRVTAWDMTELSLVDRGANPDCYIELVKGDVVTKAVAKDDMEAADKSGDGKKPFPPAKDEAKPEEKPEEKPPAEEEKPAEKPPEKPKAKGSKFQLCNKCSAGIAAEAIGEAAKEAIAAHVAALKTRLKAADPMFRKSQEAWDIRVALDCLGSLEMLLANETLESADGQHAEAPEQIAALQTAIAALKAFTASEAQELLPGEVALEAPASEGVAPLEMAAVPTMLKSLTERVESLPVLDTEPLAKADAVNSLQKAVSELKDGVAVELKAIREGIEIIKAQPMPGGPLRNVTPQLLKSMAADTNANSRVSVLEEMVADADPITRPRLLAELERAKLAARNAAGA